MGLGQCQTIGEAQAAKISTSGTAVLCRPFVPAVRRAVASSFMPPMPSHFWGQTTKNDVAIPLYIYWVRSLGLVHDFMTLLRIILPPSQKQTSR